MPTLKTNTSATGLKPVAIQECPVHSIQNFMFSYIQHIWGATALVVFAFLMSKLLM
jgi:hypothetical protein